MGLFISTHLSQLPSFSVFAADEFVGVGGVGFEGLWVPINFVTEAIGDVAEVIGFGEWAGVIEGTSGGRARFAGVDPFLVMA